MSNKFLFRIIAADGKIYSDKIDELYVRNTNNDIVGVLAGHFPMVTAIPISTFKIKKDGVETEFAISGGILNVEKQTVYILADTYESASEIDKIRNLTKKEKYEKELLEIDKHDIERIEHAELALKKVINRLSLLK